MEWLNQLSVLDVLTIIVLYDSLVQALPKPKRGEGKLYRFGYSLAHALARNWKHAMQEAKGK